MEFYQEIALSASMGLGLFIGAIIAHNTLDEVKNGVKFIKIFMISLFYISIFLAMLKVYANILLAAFMPTLIILSIHYLPKSVFRFSKDYLFIGVLAITASISLSEGIDYIVYSLIFLTLLCIGTLQYLHKHDAKDKRRMYSSFLIKFLVFAGISAFPAVFRLILKSI
jgi:hypothetical protein